MFALSEMFSLSLTERESLRTFDIHRFQWKSIPYLSPTTLFFLPPLQIVFQKLVKVCLGEIWEMIGMQVAHLEIMKWESCGQNCFTDDASFNWVYLKVPVWENTICQFSNVILESTACMYSIPYYILYTENCQLDDSDVRNCQLAAKEICFLISSELLSAPGSNPISLYSMYSTL